MSEYLVGIYKEIGKKPDIVKIKNQKEVHNNGKEQKPRKVP